LAAASSTFVTYNTEVAPAPTLSIHDAIVLTGPGGQIVATRGFSAYCIPSAGSVTVSPSQSICPYLTTFSVNVFVVVGPQTSAYKWIFEDGSELNGSVTFAGTGFQIQTVTVKRKVQAGSKGVSAAFQPNEHASSTAPATATCSF
jgi:hypothetical protein